jgi:hypothetical protein
MDNTMKGLSILYKDSLYEIDLFDIFKDVTMFEKYCLICDCESKNVNEKLRKKFINKIYKKIVNLKLKYDIFSPITNTIKNNIMIVSILRKLITTVKKSGNDFIKFNINNDMMYYISVINQIFS